LDESSVLNNSMSNPLLGKSNKNPVVNNADEPNILHAKARNESLTSHKEGSGSSKILTMFTTLTDVPDRLVLQQNVLHNWPLVMPGVNLVLFVSPETMNYQDLALELGWNVQPVPSYDRFGVPLIKEMFLVVLSAYNTLMYGYCNGDVLFTDDFMKTVGAVLSHHNENHQSKGTLIVGRRIDVIMDSSQTLFKGDSVRKYAKQGKLHRKSGLDFFIFTRNGYPLDQLPNLAIGKPYWDGVFLGLAVKNGLQTVDSTKTLLAMHQSYKGNQSNGYTPRQGLWSNKKFVMKNVCGATSCTSHYTDYGSDRTIHILSRQEKAPRKKL